MTGEKFVRYTTTVDDLTDVWAFVMTHVDEFNGRPSIEVRAMTIHDLVLPIERTGFAVAVFGTVTGG
ncbi:MAG: hypothetical protein QM753_06860 [Thermomicrobiales bacterium]